MMLIRINITYQTIDHNGKAGHNAVEFLMCHGYLKDLALKKTQQKCNIQAR